MAANPTATTSVQDETLRFLELPGELRNAIYRVSLVGKNQRWFSLTPPPFTQVCRQIRAEALPIFYAENEFYISLAPVLKDGPRDDARDAMDSDPLLAELIRLVAGPFLFERKEEDWGPVIEVFSRMAANGGLKFITRLSATYWEPMSENPGAFIFGFEMTASDDGDEQSPPSEDGGMMRVGSDTLDWNDRQAVEAAFSETAQRCVCISWMEDMDMANRVPLQKIMDALFTVAKHCDRANKHVELSMDYDSLQLKTGLAHIDRRCTGYFDRINMPCMV